MGERISISTILQPENSQNWMYELEHMVDDIRHRTGCGFNDLVWELHIDMYNAIWNLAMSQFRVASVGRHIDGKESMLGIKINLRSHNLVSKNLIILKEVRETNYNLAWNNAVKNIKKEIKMKRSKYIWENDETNWLEAAKKVTINDVMFKPPATIIFWSDNTKTSVVCRDGDIYDPEKGLALAICKKAYGNTGGFNDIFKKWLPKEEIKNEETGPCCECTHMPSTERLFSNGAPGLSKACRECIKGTKNNFKKKEK